MGYIKTRTQEIEYNKYLKSAKWKAKRGAAIDKAGNKCQRCGYPAYKLEVHHLSYEHLFDEPPGDLLVVCKSCHEIEDGKRVVRTMERNANALHDAQLNGWANKVYGEGWSERVNVDYVEERFNRWLEVRGE